MSVNLKSASEIISDLGLEPGGDVNYFAATQARARMNARYVPEDEGTLHDTSLVDSTDCSIIYYQPYASYQYYGMRKDGTHVVKNYSKKETRPYQGPYWDKLMMTAEGKELTKDVEDYIKLRGKK